MVLEVESDSVCELGALGCLRMLLFITHSPPYSFAAAVGRRSVSWICLDCCYLNIFYHRVCRINADPGLDEQAEIQWKVDPSELLAPCVKLKSVFQQVRARFCRGIDPRTG